MELVQDKFDTDKEGATSLSSGDHVAWHKPVVTKVDMKRTMVTVGSGDDGYGSSAI